MSHSVALSFKSSIGRGRSHTNGLACAAAIVTLAWAGAASAASWPHDPRVCPPQTAKSAACAYGNARLALRKHLGTGGLLFQGPTSCTQAATMLRWNCVAGAGGGDPGTAELVVFSVKNHHWFVSVTP